MGRFDFARASWPLWARVPRAPTGGFLDLETRTLAEEPDKGLLNVSDPHAMAQLAMASWERHRSRGRLRFARAGAFRPRLRREPLSQPKASYHALPKPKEPLRGRVRQALQRCDDLKLLGDDAQRAVAAQLEYTLNNGAAVTLRVGWCEQFEVDLDDGRLVRIPSGSLILSAPSARWRELDEEVAREYLRELVPGHQGLQNTPFEDPFPFEQAILVTLAPGDRVAVSQPLLRTLEPTIGSYRDGAAAVMSPSRTARIELLAR